MKTLTPQPHQSSTRAQLVNAPARACGARPVVRSGARDGFVLLRTARDEGEPTALRAWRPGCAARANMGRQSKIYLSQQP
jgi:hypothetical protein